MDLNLNSQFDLLENVYSSDNQTSRSVVLFLKKHENVGSTVNHLKRFNNQLPHIDLNVYQYSETDLSKLIELVTKMDSKDTTRFLFVGNATIEKALYDGLQLKEIPFGLTQILSSMSKGTSVQHQIEHAKPNVKVYNTVGHQIHLSHPEILSAAQRLGTSISLGALLQKPAIAEPLCRQSVLAIFRMDAMAHGEIPSMDGPHVCGLDRQTALQLAYFLGRSPHLRILNLQTEEITESEQALQWIASCIWYFLQGRSAAYTVDFGRCQEYLVQMDDQEYKFLKDHENQQWYLENPNAKEDMSVEWKYIPCAYENYALMARGELDEYLARQIELLQT